MGKTKTGFTCKHGKDPSKEICFECVSDATKKGPNPLGGSGVMALPVSAPLKVDHEEEKRKNDFIKKVFKESFSLHEKKQKRGTNRWN